MTKKANVKDDNVKVYQEMIRNIVKKIKDEKSLWLIYIFARGRL